jgi:hypothetical protein
MIFCERTASGKGVEYQEWLVSIRKRRRKQTLRAFVAAGLVTGLWLTVSGLCFWAWGAVFRQAMPGGRFIALCEVLGSLVVLPLSKFVPLAPLKGEDPEIAAAREFLEGPPR